MQRFIAACLDAAKEVEALLRATDHAYGCEPQQKGAGGDVSIGYDLLSEACFVRHLNTFGQIYSEESGYIGEGDDLIILDPIDGSDNLKSNFPYYGASVALQRHGKTIAGFVCNFASGDCFIRHGDEMFRSSLFREEKRPISVNIHTKVGLFEKAGLHPGAARALMDLGLKFRAPGATALSLAYAHEVKYMIFMGGPRTFDIAAGLFLCEELYHYMDENILIVSHNKDIFAKILTIFNLSDKQA